MTYQERIGQTFKELGTTAADWTPCGISSFKENKKGELVPMWSWLEGYKNAVTRYSAEGHCHLCGHPIFNLYYIQCDKLKLILCVGSECVENYDMAKIVEHKKAEWKSKAIKAEFDQLVEKLEKAYNAQIKRRMWSERWLWECHKIIKSGKIDTTRKGQNFIKKYKPKLENAILTCQMKAAGIV